MEYSCFTILFYFLLHSKANQLYVCMHLLSLRHPPPDLFRSPQNTGLSALHCVGGSHCFSHGSAYYFFFPMFSYPYALQELRLHIHQFTWSCSTDYLCSFGSCCLFSLLSLMWIVSIGYAFKFTNLDSTKCNVSSTPKFHCFSSHS